MPIRQTFSQEAPAVSRKLTVAQRKLYEKSIADATHSFARRYASRLRSAAPKRTGNLARAIRVYRNRRKVSLARGTRRTSQRLRCSSAVWVGAPYAFPVNALTGFLRAGDSLLRRFPRDHERAVRLRLPADLR